MNETDLMLTSILRCRPVDLVTDSVELTKDQKQEFDQMLKRKSDGEPIQYILGQTDFMGIPIDVDERVLIPRPETEILTDLAIKKIESIIRKETITVLDLGTGSGNIAIAIAKNIKNCNVTTVDISEEALTVARANAIKNNVEEKIQFIASDMDAYIHNVCTNDITYDVIISNPPYIPTSQLGGLPEDVQREPILALDGGVDGMKYFRIIIQNSHQILNKSGFLLMEIGDEQRVCIESLVKPFAQYQNIRFYRDYVGANRIVELNV